MVKAKKQEKSIEQRLEEALVLYEKTPYELPKNWCWTRVENCFSMKNGYAFRQSDFNKNGKIPVIKIRNLQDGEIVVDDKTDYVLDNFSSEFTISSGDLLVALSGATTGKFGIYKLKEKAYLNQRVGNIGINSNCIVEKYRNYFFEKSSEEILKSAYGGAQPNISWNDIKLFFFPLAPLEEQKRIVEIIDKQLAKLDEARDLIQKSLDSFADRKSAILHKAFTGELTKNWREIRHKQFDWKNKKLNEVCPLITDGTHQTPTYTDESGYIFLSSKNVRAGVIDWDNIKYIPESLHKELYSRLAPRKDDILLAKNGTTGIAAIVDRDCVFDIYVSLALIRPNILEVIPKYLLYAISTPEVKQYFDSSLKGIGVPNLHLKYIRETIIPIPSLDEQEEIVRILDSIFEKEDKSKELIDMLDKIDEMKKSILARAFRGQLGTSNPTDEPATDLLKKILEQNN